MSRNFITQAIVLKTNRIGEIHKGIVLLTKDLGIISAIAHGARKIKSRLRAYTQLFSYAKVYLYYNPVKQTYKITDIESVFPYDAVVQSLKKYYIISVCAEVTLKSFGGGESVKEMFFLILNILKILNRVNENDADFILIQFLWRFLLITGHRPDLKNCSHCNTQISGPVIIYYSDGMPGFVCGKCKKLNAVQLYPGIIYPCRPVITHIGLGTDLECLTSLLCSL